MVRIRAALGAPRTPVVDPRGLIKRDAEFVSNVLRGMDRTEAMRVAGEALGVEFSDARARQLAAQAEQKPEVVSALLVALEEAGINDRLIATKLKEGTDAIAFTQTGNAYEDMKTRLAYLRTIMQVKGQIGADVDNSSKTLVYQSFKDDEGASNG